MTALAKKEYIVIGFLLGILFASMIPSLLYARKEKRDGIRRDEIAAMKRALEGINNVKGVYPLEFKATPHQYIVTDKDSTSAKGWFLRVELENPTKDELGFDEEAGRNYFFRILNEHGHIYYDVCGGEDTCGQPPKE